MAAIYKEAYKKTYKNFRCNLISRNKNNKINEKDKTNKKNRKNKLVDLASIRSYLIFCSLGFLCTTSAFAAGDLLGDALVDIKSNFGLGSVFIKVLYLMEIYYGWRKYRETNNPLAVGSIVLVAMALTYAIGKWIGA